MRYPRTRDELEQLTAAYLNKWRRKSDGMPGHERILAALAWAVLVLAVFFIWYHH
jgi:hypothetical protein